MSDPILSIVIPAYNEELYIANGLESFVSEIDRSGVPAEIIVVDNACTDRTAEIATRFPSVSVVRENRKGLTFARECGFKASKGLYIANIDADMRMPAGWIKKVLNAFDKDPKLVCISGPHVHYDLNVFFRGMVFLYWALLAVPSYWLVGYMAVGGNFTAKRDALTKIGGFDTTIEFYGEDTDIARRLSAVGRVKFSLPLYIYTSARRLKDEGIIKTAFFYGANFISEVVIKKPVTVAHKDIR